MELKIVLDDLLKMISSVNVKVDYIHVGLTKLGKKVHEVNSSIVEYPQKEVMVNFNSYDDSQQYEKDLVLKLSRLHEIIRNNFADRKFYLSEFEKVLRNIYVVSQKRKPTLFRRGDINEYINPKSDYWTDEVDDHIASHKELLVSNFIKVQRNILDKIIKVLGGKVSVERIEDFINDSEKLSLLKEWLRDNEYLNDDDSWGGNKRQLAFVLSYIIHLKGFSKMKLDYKSLIKIGTNSFGLNVSLGTFEKVMNSELNRDLKEQFKNLRCD